MLLNEQAQRRVISHKHTTVHRKDQLSTFATKVVFQVLNALQDRSIIILPIQLYVLFLRIGDVANYNIIICRLSSRKRKNGHQQHDAYSSNKDQFMFHRSSFKVIIPVTLIVCVKILFTVQVYGKISPVNITKFVILL